MSLVDALGIFRPFPGKAELADASARRRRSVCPCCQIVAGRSHRPDHRTGSAAGAARPTLCTSHQERTPHGTQAGGHHGRGRGRLQPTDGRRRIGDLRPPAGGSRRGGGALGRGAWRPRVQDHRRRLPGGVRQRRRGPERGGGDPGRVRGAAAEAADRAQSRRRHPGGWRRVRRRGQHGRAHRGHGRAGRRLRQCGRGPRHRQAARPALHAARPPARQEPARPDRGPRAAAGTGAARVAGTVGCDGGRAGAAGGRRCGVVAWRAAAGGGPRARAGTAGCLRRQRRQPPGGGGAAVRQSQRRPVPGLFQRRPERGHHHRARPQSRADGDRAQLDLRLQGPPDRHPRGGCQARRPLRGRGQHAPGRRPAAGGGAADRRRDRGASLVAEL